VVIYHNPIFYSIFEKNLKKKTKNTERKKKPKKYVLNVFALFPASFPKKKKGNMYLIFSDLSIIMEGR